MKVLVFALLMSVSSSSLAFESCENFAAKYSLDRVTTELILESTSIFANNFYPSEPELLERTESDDGPVEKYETVITVSPKSDTTVATRYYVTLSVLDQDASCSLIIGSDSVELEH